MNHCYFVSLKKYFYKFHCRQFALRTKFYSKNICKRNKDKKPVLFVYHFRYIHRHTYANLKKKKQFSFNIELIYLNDILVYKKRRHKIKLRLQQMKTSIGVCFRLK